MMTSSDIDGMTMAEIHGNNLQTLKDFIDNPNSDESLKMQILQWMWDNLQIINDPKKSNPNYSEEVQIFLQLIENSR